MIDYGIVKFVSIVITLVFCWKGSTADYIVVYINDIFNNNSWG